MAEQTSSPPMFNVQIDGVWHQFPKGMRVIEACEQAGSYVPRYCYHKKLSSPGNCRMCLIEMGLPKLGPDRKPELGADSKPVINWMARPQISCAQDDVLGFVDRGSYTVLTAHPDKRLENNYSLNTVDICPVGALTSTDFRFKMRVWFLKETKSICTSCATGCNTIIGTREDVIYRQTPRENDAVNSCWMCDYGRLNFDYLQSERRLLEPRILSGENLSGADWSVAIAQASLDLRRLSGHEIAIVASGRMTNEELWLTLQLAKILDVHLIDIVPRTGPGNDVLLSADR